MSEKIDFSSIPVKSDEIRSLNLDIAAQNVRYEIAGDIEEGTDLRKFVSSEISGEQLDSFRALIEAGHQVPYEAMGKKILEINSMLSNVFNPELPLSKVNRERLERIERDVEIAMRLLPTRSKDIERIKGQEIEGVQDDERSKRERLAANLKAELDEVLAALKDYGRWTIPSTLSGDDRLTWYNAVKENMSEGEDLEVVLLLQDVMPVDPEERARQASLVERAKCLDIAKDASKLMALYFKESDEQVVPVEDLVEFTYAVKPEPGDKAHYRNRVTTLLGPKVQGKRMQRTLQDDFGLFLQYGWRHIIEVKKDGRRIDRSRQRIYRAVRDPETATKGVVNEMRVKKGSGIMTSVIKSKGLVIDTFDAPVIPEPIEQAPVEEHPESTSIVDTSEATATTEVKIDNWQEDFIKSVDIAIALLVNDLQFEDDEMRGNSIRNYSSSKKLGLKTIREQLVGAHFMKNEEFKSDVMSREQRVIALVFSSQRKILAKGAKHRAEAVEIIQTRIAQKLVELTPKKPQKS